MSCQNRTLKGIQNDCMGSVAGLKKLYFGLADSISAVTYTDSAYTINSLTLKSGEHLYEYYVTDESSSLTSQMTRNSQNGVFYITNTINATFVRMTPEKNLEMQALISEKLFCIAQDNNNYYWAIGVRDSFATASQGNAQTGQAFDDLSGYQLQVDHRSGFYAYAISEEIVNSLLPQSN